MNSALRLESPGNECRSAANQDKSTLASDKLHVGCGSNAIPGWQNRDLDLDIRGSLPFPDESLQFVFGEHVVEHITPAEALGFFREVRRVLRPGGAMRIIVPCVDLIHERYDEKYGQFLRSKIGGAGSLESAIESIITNWEHKAIWTTKALQAILESLGFKTVSLGPRESCFPEMAGIDGHAAAIGEHANWVESGVVEAVKWQGHRATGEKEYPPLRRIPN